MELPPRHFLLNLSIVVILAQLLNVSVAADELEWTRLFPTGGQTGATKEIEAKGKFPVWPLKVWSNSDSIRWSCLKDAGKLEVTIDADAPLGLHWVRLYDENGATSVRPFLVGRSVERNEAEPNDRLKEANDISAYPLAIHGILSKKGDVDLFSLSLAAGQLLVATIDAAKWLQSPVDVNLQILDNDGFVLAENLDHIGLDPYLEFVAPRDDRFTVRVFGFPAAPDSKIGFGGGSDWVYRLRLESTSGAFGSPIAFPMQSELDAECVSLKPGQHIIQGQALAISLPARICGLVSEANETHYLRFAARSGSHYRVRLLAREFGSSLDPTIAILDANGKQLAQSDDVETNHRDPVLLWKANKDGDYFITIGDFHRSGGRNYQYLAIIEDCPPNFDVSIANDWIQATVGKEAGIKVKVLRESGFADSISVSMDGLPDSVTCSQETSTVEPKGASKEKSKNENDSSKLVTLRLKGSTVFQGPVKIVARSDQNENLVRTATADSNKPIWLSIAPK